MDEVNTLDHGRDKHLGQGEHHGRGEQPPNKSKLNELISSNKILATCLLQQMKILLLINIYVKKYVLGKIDNKVIMHQFQKLGNKNYNI